MYPVRIGFSWGRSADMGMQVGTVTVLYHAAVKDVRAFLGGDYSLRMDSKMQAIEIINCVPQYFLLGSQKYLQSLRLFTAFNFGHLPINDGYSDGFIEVRRNSDVS